MDSERIINILSRAPSPCFVVDTALLKQNLNLLKDIQNEAGCSILLALKGFAMWSLFPMIREYLPGVCASGPIEARLGREKFGGEVHTYSPAYTGSNIDKVLEYSDHVVFNSFSQWNAYREKALSRKKKISFGLRINPQVSTGKTSLYDPCSPFSRLGITSDKFRGQSLEGINGFHFHTLCEQDSDSLEITLDAVEEKFGRFLELPEIEWINFGGGHHITRSGYNVDLLLSLIQRFKKRYRLKVYLEPGEAVVLNTGFMTADVIDIVNNDMNIAILNTSAACHNPDILEMPYRPEIIGAGNPEEKKYTYRLGGVSCLAGDVIGDYSFDAPLKPGSRIVFTDMAHYTMVKTNTFNGVLLPSIAVMDSDRGTFSLIKKFGYEDYVNRLS